MKIRHKNFGEHEGAERIKQEPPPGCFREQRWIEWSLRGARYLADDGWEEVPETRLVDVTGSVICMHSSIKLYVALDDELESWEIKGLPPKHNWRKVDRYDLPKDLINRFGTDFSLFVSEAKDICDYLEEFKKPYLIIEKEEPCP